MTPKRRLFAYLLRHRTLLLFGFLSVVGSAIFSLLKPMVIGNAVNELTVSIGRGTLVHYALLLVGVSAMEGLFLYVQRQIIIGASRRIEYEMRNDFYDHLQRLPLRFYQDQRTGDLMSRATNDLASVRMLIGPAIMHVASSLLVVGGAFVMMYRIDHQLALISLIAVPVIAGLVKYFGQRIHVHFKSVQDYFGEVSARVQENLAGVRVVRAFAQEKQETDTFLLMNREYVNRNMKLIRLTATFYPMLHAMIGIMFVIVFFMGSRKMLAGTMTIGSFVAFQFYLGRMIWPLIALGWVINLFQRGMASMQRLHDVWSVTPDSVGSGVGAADELRGSIDIRDLTFAYPRPLASAIGDARINDGATMKPVLRNVSLHVEAGQTIGIVGRTGSGKSTLLALITRVFEPPPGTVEIDGRPIESIPLPRLRDSIGMVPQETFLFSESIAENIRFGRADANDAEVQEAADMAGLSGDVTAFANGLDTVIGERGITLSGGQKQRTAIARALVRNPLILMLDDALSAVDTATEERILRALRAVRQGRTVLIVSHRVSSVKDADHIVVLDDGEIVERGTHESLLERGGYYSDLYRRQTIEAEIEEIA
jgi:ATP-binding cassette subfamily B protein